MEQPTNKSSRAISLSLAAGLVITLLTAGTVRPAGAQTNTSLGTGALGKNTTGTDNTALGFASLFENTTNSNNTAVGANTLGANVADDNTAVGANALSANSDGDANTATGFDALFSNQGGGFNTATGFEALMNNTMGVGNTATGGVALQNNTTGADNTATGQEALASNTNGIRNTATGSSALQNNTAGTSNTADGAVALYADTTGIRNTATGDAALERNTTGSGNIAVGAAAGSNLTTGNNNIDIGNVGVATDTNTIRIGTKGTQTRALIAGIYTSPVYGSPVYVHANGRLGVAVSSARYKRDIHDMGDASARLLQLRPVSFRYRQDPKGMLQYGLVAEEVERVYPELVTRDDDGKVMGVRYDVIPALLLNEMLKQARDNQRKGCADRRLAETARCTTEAGPDLGEGDSANRCADRAPEHA